MTPDERPTSQEVGPEYRMYLKAWERETKIAAIREQAAEAKREHDFFMLRYGVFDA